MSTRVTSARRARSLRANAIVRLIDQQRVVGDEHYAEWSDALKATVRRHVHACRELATIENHAAVEELSQ